MNTPSGPTATPDPITMTETAAQKALDLMEKANMDPDTTGLRLYIQQGGCAGLSYGMRFDSEPRDDDHVFETHGLRVFIDPASHQHVQQSRLSYDDGLQGAGFFVENPNSEAECGCGESFRT